MKRIASFCLLLSSVLVASNAAADTIHLKNGSVIKGKVASFADDQFVVVIDTGSSRYMSRAMIFIGDVARIEFDSAPSAASEGTPLRDGTQSRDTSSPRETPAVRETARESSPLVIQPTRDGAGTKSTGTQVRDDSQVPSKESAKEAAKESEPVATSTSTQPTADVSESVPPSSKKGSPGKTVTVDVAAKRDWTSTGLIIKRGDRIRINASGTVTLDPTSQQTSGPEGIDLTDARKLMADRPTGALIGVIGADNDDFIFVGRSAEFTATRDGLLFLSVNEGALSDNTGTYKASIEVQSQGGRRP